MICTNFDLLVHPKRNANFQLNPISGFGKVEKDFQDGRHGDHIGYRISTICKKFDLLLALMLHTKFQLSPISGFGGRK